MDQGPLPGGPFLLSDDRYNMRLRRAEIRRYLFHAPQPACRGRAFDSRRKRTRFSLFSVGRTLREDEGVLDPGVLNPAPPVIWMTPKKILWRYSQGLVVAWSPMEWSA